MSITAKNIIKRFGAFTALDDVTLEVGGGQLVAVLGPSGSGKSTLLRIIAGLELPDSGSVLYHDDDVTESHVRERNVGFVFQHYALFRHMNVFENIAFGLRVRKWAKDQIEHRVNELIQLVQLEGLGRSLPSQLSGGQRQRVALARALAPSPKVLLLDEPFGALDAKVRTELRQWLRRLHEEIHVTSLFVTHDQEEAFEVADQVVVMNHGKIEQVGAPGEIFEHPANPFVMDFLGDVNVFHGRVEGGRVMLGDLAVDYPDQPHQEGRTAMAFVRSHELEVSRSWNGRGSALKAEVVQVNPARGVVKIRLIAADFGLALNVDVGWDRFTELRLSVGDHVYVAPRRVRVFVEDYAI